jgi:hypothetical protein
MSAAFEKLRAIRVRIAALRAAGIDDYANLSALFNALEKIIPEATARRAVGVGFYFAGNMSSEMSSEFEAELGNLLNAIDGLIKQSEGLSQ